MLCEAGNEAKTQGEENRQKGRTTPLGVFRTSARYVSLDPRLVDVATAQAE